MFVKEIEWFLTIFEVHFINDQSNQNSTNQDTREIKKTLLLRPSSSMLTDTRVKCSIVSVCIHYFVAQ
jgi:hypothetical protein